MARITELRVWSNSDCKFSRDYQTIGCGFGASASKLFDTELTEEEIVEEASGLYRDVVRPAIENQIKLAKEEDALFKKMYFVERKKLNDSYQKEIKILKRRANEIKKDK